MLTIAWGGVASAGDSQQLVMVPDEIGQGGSIALLEHASVLHDQGGRLAIDAVSDPARADAFEPLEGVFSRGFSSDAFWVRMRLARAAGSDEETLWLVAQPWFLQDLRLFVPRPDGRWQQLRGGAHVPHSQRPLLQRGHVFPLSVSEQPQTYYLRVASASALVLSLTLWAPDAYLEHSMLETAGHGVFFGLVLAAVLITLSCYLWIRQRFFLVAAGYFAVFGLLQAVLNGYDQWWLYPQAPWLSERAIGTLVALQGAFVIYFALAFLQPQAFYPRLQRLLQWLAGLMLVAAAMSALGAYGEIAAMANLTGAVSAPLFLAFLGLMLKHRRRATLLLLITLAPPLLAVFLQTLRNLGVLPFFWTGALWEWSIIVQLPFSAMVVMARLRDEAQLYRRGRDDAQIRSDFLRMMGHELRTPLSVIEMATENLSQRTASTHPEFRPRFRRLRSAIRRLGRLVENALAEERLHEDLRDLEREQVWPSELVAEVDALADMDPDQHTLVFTFEGTNEPVSMDRYAVVLAVLNLLDNAVKYSPEGGLISFNARREQDGLRLTVTDQGMGIGKTEYGRIFDSGYRGTDAMSMTGTGGLGLGLHLVQRVAERHHGWVSVDSERDRGSCFELWIPG